MNYLCRILAFLPVLCCFAFITLKEKKTVVIDPGHGGDDHGVMHDDVSEKLLVQAIAAKIKSIDTEEEIEVVLLREDDHFISLNERVEKINQLNPDLLISLHINHSLDKKENGVSAYISQKNRYYEKSAEKAKHLLDNLAGKKLATRGVKDVNLFVLNNVVCPALFLEMGYMTNDSDRNYLCSENGQLEIANAIYGFLRK